MHDMDLNLTRNGYAETVSDEWNNDNKHYA